VVPEDPTVHETCDVCGRTILRGEQVRAYVTPQGEEAGVCALCRDRAEAAGLVPAELAGTRAQSPVARRGPTQALKARLGRAADRARGAAQARREREPEAAERPAPQPAERRKPAAEKAPQATPPQLKRRTPRTPERVMRRAIERFNASDEARKVAGLCRSLGQPNVAVRAKGQTALVTVAWELSWYQWEVDANGGARAVREIGKGDEVSELPDEARTWNAAADEDGKLRLDG
jgi:hypothetical protein